jgi:hypothetical protein
MMFGALAIGLTLWSWGQPLISASGTVRLWVNSIWSTENSQQIADWYTLSHVIHGTIVALVGRALHRWIGQAVVLGVAIATGVAWEIVEHTDWVLNQFRGQTIYQGYVGDSVLNAVCDYLFMMAGFFVAASIPVRVALAGMLGLETTSAVLVRDSLILTTLRVVHPVPEIAAWQDELNPLTHPPPQD